ncbi:MAG: sigma 54-interacting transcriptional regulator [Bacillota bacterium]|nr:sigma 54-interacting transcriptional regulator [Bacillota bacterium]
MRKKDYEAILQAAGEILGWAVHVVDSKGTTVIYNEEMAKLEKVNVGDVLGKYFRDTFSSIPEEESTLLKALQNRESTLNKAQTYYNAYGKEVTAVNSTFPVIVDGEVVAAMEVARDITDLKNMSDTILDLRRGLAEIETRTAEARDTSSENPEIPADVKKANRGINKYHFDDLIGKNKSFEEVLARAKKVAKNDVTVLIYGETGVGKELFAQSIHYDGLRSNKPFLAQNCAAFPESLLEGLLFGTVKGGFTGAIDRPGLFEQVNGGTLLLDEISAMPIGLQGKLLRVLQEQYIRRVGGEKDIPIDVRIIATINESAEDLIRQGRLREDLYYRLSTVNLSIPALRDRKDDIPLLVAEFLKRYNEKYDKEFWMVSDKAKARLMEYNYPGNVRELDNIIMAAVTMADDGHVLDEEALTIGSDYQRVPTGVSDYVASDSSLSEYLENLERTVIKQHLLRNDRNISKTAKDLGMLRQNLQHKIKKYGI